MTQPDKLISVTEHPVLIELPPPQDALFREVKNELDTIKRNIHRNMVIANAVLLSVTLMGFGVLLHLHLS